MNIPEYTLEEKEQGTKELQNYLIKEGKERFVTPYSGLRIAASNNRVNDGQLILLAKVLSQVPQKVWYDTKITGLFPGIPEEEVTIPVPLRSEIPVKYKIMRMNE